MTNLRIDHARACKVANTWHRQFVISRSAVRVRSPAPMELNNCRRSRVQTDPTRVHHCVTTNSTADRPRHTHAAKVDQLKWTARALDPRAAVTTAGQVRNRPAKSRQSEGVRHEPAAVRGGPAGRTLSSVTATPGRTPPLPARTPDPCFRSEERAAGSTANACSPSTGRTHRSVCMRRFPATVGPGDRRAGPSPPARGQRSRGPWPRPVAVHPRWRGAEVAGGEARPQRLGSIPVPGGTPRRDRFTHRPGQARFIPAGAGRTCSSRQRKRRGAEECTGQPVGRMILRAISPASLWPARGWTRQ